MMMHQHLICRCCSSFVHARRRLFLWYYYRDAPSSHRTEERIFLLLSILHVKKIVCPRDSNPTSADANMATRREGSGQTNSRASVWSHQCTRRGVKAPDTQMCIPQVCGGKVRRSNIICGRDPTRWILHQHDRYSSLSSQGGNQPAGGCLGCRYCCQRSPFHKDTPCFPTNRTLLERASHYACHHLAGQGCGGYASACPPHYHPTQMIFDTSQFSHVSLSLQMGSQNPSFVLSRPFFFLWNCRQRPKGVYVWLSVCRLWFCYKEFQLQSCISIVHCSYNTLAPQ